MVKYIWKDLRQRIFAEVGYIRCDEKFNLSAHTTVGIGGFCPALYPSGEKQLCALLKTLCALDAEFYVLGAGSNVLPRDGDYSGVVVSTADLKGISYSSTISAGAGERFSSVLRFCAERNLAGCEFMAGIPATVGGAVYMNAGVNGRHMSDVIKSVTFAGCGGIYTVPVEECRYAYKDSVFRHISRCVITRAEFYAEESPRVTGEIRRYKELRASLPKGKSMGCTFKNPEGFYAGELIEKCGLKGYYIGGASVSCGHANFIINVSSATSEDVKKLIDHIKRTVFIATGVSLEEEIEYM